MAEPATKNRKNRPDEEEEEEEDPQARAKARAWEMEHAIRVQEIRANAWERAKEQRAILMKLTPDTRLLVCRMFDPVTMFVIYDADRDTGFYDWCDTTYVKNMRGKLEERACVWDDLLLYHYGNVAGPRDESLSGDQRRWKFYAYWLTDERTIQARNAENPSWMYFVKAGDRIKRMVDYPYRTSFLYRLSIENNRIAMTYENGPEFKDVQSPFTIRLRQEGITDNVYRGTRRQILPPFAVDRNYRKYMVNIIMIMFSMEGVAYYQEWPVGSQITDDRLPVNIKATCVSCNANTTALVCGGCEEVGYCSNACAKSDWYQNGHHRTCSSSSAK